MEGLRTEKKERRDMGINNPEELIFEEATEEIFPVLKLPPVGLKGILPIKSLIFEKSYKSMVKSATALLEPLEFSQQFAQ